MEYYVPSYRKNSRLKFKRKRNKKPFILAALVLVLITSFFLLGFNSKPSPKTTASNKKEIPGSIIPDSQTGQKPSSPVAASALKDNKVPGIERLNGSGPDKANPDAGEADFALEEKTVSISSGDTLMQILVREGLARGEAHTIISAMQEVFNPRRIRQGNEITLAFATDDNYEPLFQNMDLRLDLTRSVQVARCEENGFVAREITREFDSRPVRAEAQISSSLYSAAVNAGMPVEVLMQMIRAYSFDIDFQRDILPGDSFEVLFHEQVDENGEFVRGGEVLYANLHTRGRNLPIYRHETSDGEVDFFNHEGKSVRKTLMVTPIDGARLSSGYGKRRHPILGYSRMHQGLDFAAPTGTPIMAAGDGVVEYAGRKGNYGNYIRIRHPNEYHTVYAHMSRFASGIRQGARVKQGQTIGYVGSTGMSTGPHLHYEVHHRGGHVNPATVDTPPGRTLEGEELKRFMTARKELKDLFASLERQDQVARLD
jgi:murein DD-endopeptidase MepM/ murein hydrolase activator NlpD